MTRERRVAIIVVVFSLGAIVLMWRDHFVPLVAVKDVAEFPGRLALLLVVAAFVERAVEVVLSPWRSKRSEELRIERDNAAAAERPSRDIQLAHYRSDTSRIAFWLSSGFGVVLAACGFRGLEWFIESSAPGASSLPPSQMSLLGLVDVLLTGMVIAGGADGIHRIAALLMEFLDRTRDQVDQRAAMPPAEVPRNP